MMYNKIKTTEECEEIDNVNIESDLEFQNDYETEEEFDYIAQTKPLGRLVFLVAFTAIMLISSTIEMLPVSATGVEDMGVNKEMSFYEGTNINGTELYGIKKTKAHVSESAIGSADEQYAGFFAIDLFLQNSSKVTESEQGTARVALAMYDTTGLTNNASTVGTDTSSIFVTANQSQILTAYEGKKISDIAIWEPNASTHVENIVTNNNTLKLNTTDDATGLSKQVALQTDTETGYTIQDSTGN